MNNKGHFTINIVPFIWLAIWCGLTWPLWFLIRLLFKA